MFRNDKPLGILFALIIAASLFTSQIAYADQISNNAAAGTKSEVKTVEVKRGEYTEKSSLKNMEIVPTRQDTLRIDAGAIYEGTLVHRGQMVKKDDPLVAYTVDGDTVALDEKKFSLEQNEKAFKDSTARKQADIAKSVSQLQKMDGSTTDAKILQLNIQKMQIALDQYVYKTQKSIEDQKTEIKDMEDSMGTQYLKAPYDGYIMDAQDRMPKGSEINGWNNEFITIADVKSAVLSAKAAGAKNLWYGLSVKVTPVSRGVEDTSKVYNGRVITTSSILNGRVNTEDIYVTFDGLQSMASPDMKANIEVDAVDVKDVLVIPLTAVKKEDTMNYVYILDAKGQLQKQYISGRNNGVDMWVYNGLTEGQQIVIE